MEKSVSIVLRTGERIDIHVAESEFDGLEPKAGRRMIAELYEQAGIEAATPTGKILLVDQILLLAQEQKTEVWREPTPQLRRILAATLCALGRDNLTINLKDQTL